MVAAVQEDRPLCPWRTAARLLRPLLLLTATPHKGDPENFSLFLQLLDEDAYADVSPSARRWSAPRPVLPAPDKRGDGLFPGAQPDGTWEAQKIFTKRIPHTVDFHIDGAEDELYREVTSFVKRTDRTGRPRGDDPRARAVRFLMALYQRRLASSTYALRRSLENRAKRLGDGLKKAQELARRRRQTCPTWKKWTRWRSASASG